MGEHSIGGHVELAVGDARTVWRPLGSLDARCRTDHRVQVRAIRADGVDGLILALETDEHELVAVRWTEGDALDGHPDIQDLRLTRCGIEDGDRRNAPDARDDGKRSTVTRPVAVADTDQWLVAHLAQLEPSASTIMRSALASGSPDADRRNVIFVPSFVNPGKPSTAGPLVIRRDSRVIGSPT